MHKRNSSVISDDNESNNESDKCFQNKRIKLDGEQKTPRWKLLQPNWPTIVKPFVLHAGLTRHTLQKKPTHAASTPTVLERFINNSLFEPHLIREIVRHTVSPIHRTLTVDYKTHSAAIDDIRDELLVSHDTGITVYDLNGEKLRDILIPPFRGNDINEDIDIYHLDVISEIGVCIAMTFTNTRVFIIDHVKGTILRSFGQRSENFYLPFGVTHFFSDDGYANPIIVISDMSKHVINAYNMEGTFLYRFQNDECLRDENDIYEREYTGLSVSHVEGKGHEIYAAAGSDFISVFSLSGRVLRKIPRCSRHVYHYVVHPHTHQQLILNTKGVYDATDLSRDSVLRDLTCDDLRPQLSIHRRTGHVVVCHTKGVHLFQLHVPT